MRHLRHSILYLHCQTLVVWLILILLIRAGTLAPSAWYEWVAASVLFVLPFGFYQWYGDTEAWRRLFCSRMTRNVPAMSRVKTCSGAPPVSPPVTSLLSAS